ncbi:MAG: hypothetical protein IJQ31_14830, partial [Thermoguttaceae bacterium]|nr:hypothetical protein [Thermoguttaceae bacterium]
FIKKMGMMMGTKCYEVKRSNIGLSPQNTALNQEKEKDLNLLQVQKIPLGGLLESVNYDVWQGAGA